MIHIAGRGGAGRAGPIRGWLEPEPRRTRAGVEGGRAAAARPKPSRTAPGLGGPGIGAWGRDQGRCRGWVRRRIRGRARGEPGPGQARAVPSRARSGPSRAEPDLVHAAWSTRSGRAARGKPPGPSRAERVPISGSPLVHSEEAENSHTAAAAAARAATAASSDAATADHRRAGAPARDANMDTCGRQHECIRVHHRRPSADRPQN
jgi:hypothetical protein